MKNTALKTYIGISFLMSFFFFFGCSKYESTDQNSKRNSSVSNLEAIENQAILVGKLHNLGLEVIYEKLQNRIQDEMDYYETKQVLTEVCLEHTTELVEDDRWNIFLDPLTTYFEYLEDSRLSPDLILPELIETSKLSPESKSILFSIEELFSNELSTDKDVLDGIDNAISLAKTNITDNIELGVVLGALYTGKYSSQYWETELDKWNQLTNIEVQVMRRSSIIRADLEAALAGGLIGAAAGGTVSLGTLTVPAWVAGAVLAGSAASAAAALGNVLDWLFGWLF